MEINCDGKEQRAHFEFVTTHSSGDFDFGKIVKYSIDCEGSGLSDGLDFLNTDSSLGDCDG